MGASLTIEMLDFEKPVIELEWASLCFVGVGSFGYVSTLPPIDL